MSKTPYSKQVDILADFYILYGDDDTIDQSWKDFLKLHDIGFPMSFLIKTKLVEPTVEGEEYIDNTWKDFCEALTLDHDAEWSNLSQMFDARKEKL
jgi:hypothetical protein